MRYTAAPQRHSVCGQGGSQLAALDLSEVFLLSDDLQLAAVSADNPGAGVVNFGTLPNSASQATMFGLAPGPHRLLQTTLDGSPASHEVIYVDTRDENSLRVLSSQPSGEANQRPLPGF